jgi:hypothetical protein
MAARNSAAEMSELWGDDDESDYDSDDTPAVTHDTDVMTARLKNLGYSMVRPHR